MEKPPRKSEERYRIREVNALTIAVAPRAGQRVGEGRNKTAAAATGPWLRIVCDLPTAAENDATKPVLTDCLSAP